MTYLAATSKGDDRLPLCVSYSGMLFGAILANAGEPCVETQCSVTWGLGVHLTGESEVVGVWPTAGPESMAAQLVADDLLVRGMQHVSLLLNGASEELGAAVLRAFPGASVALPFHPTAQLALSVALPRDRKVVLAGLNRIRRAQSGQHADAILDALASSTWQGAPAVVQICRAAIRQWQAIYALPVRARERVRRGEDAAWLLQQGVSRALARQGAFESAEAAAAFAEAWLFDAERRARRQRLAAAHKADRAAAAASA